MEDNNILSKYIYSPIFVFQMGKVGSKSIVKTLRKNQKSPVIHSHNYNDIPHKWKKNIKLRKRLNLPVYIISPIRDPISRNVSEFFHNFSDYTGFNIANSNWNISELKKLFLKYCRHTLCLEWINKELRALCDIDVMSIKFPIDLKWKTYSKNSLKLLIFRTDLQRKEQLKAISKFLGKKMNAYDYDNLASQKSYYDIYKNFISKSILPDLYI